MVTPNASAPFSSSALDYAQGIGFNAGAVVWGPPERIELNYGLSDPNDGIDNDGDGLVDEREIVWRENPGLANERSFVLCRNVAELLDGEVLNGNDDNGNGLIDEAGLCFDFDGKRVMVRITVQGADAHGLLISKTAQQAVSLRNEGN